MPSPFPGMDPYLDRHWRDVHHRLITYIGDALQRLLPRGLVTRAEERTYAPSDEYAASPRFEPKAQQERRDPSEPYIIPLRPDPVTEGFLQIEEATAGRVVTVIEVLSPGNRLPGDGQTVYRQKQQELLASDASLVEIDLFRRGRSVVMAPAMYRRRSAAYCVCVKRRAERTRCEYYPLSLRERLPGFRIPLRAIDDDVPLFLQPLIDLVYRNGRYERLDYTKPCEPPLEPEDEAWADALLRSAGRR